MLKGYHLNSKLPNTRTNIMRFIFLICVFIIHYELAGTSLVQVICNHDPPHTGPGICEYKHSTVVTFYSVKPFEKNSSNPDKINAESRDWFGVE